MIRFASDEKRAFACNGMWKVVFACVSVVKKIISDVKNT